VADELKEERHQILLSLLRQHSIRRHRELVGTIQNVLIEGSSPKDPSRLVGRTPSYEKVVVRRPEVHVGQIISVTITSSSDNTLYADEAS
jgi:tRNA-2-methylthio-N6-dimethylallyladenosine synthase